MSDITILGTGRPNSSLNIYSKEFSVASGRERIVVINSKDQLELINDYDARVVKGIFRFIPGNGWAFNNVFGKLVYRKLKKKLSGSPIHYTTFGLPVLRNNTSDLVTIHDLFFLDPLDESYSHLFNVSRYLVNRFLDYSNIISPSYYIKEKLKEYGFTGTIDVVYIPVQDGFKIMPNKDEIRKSLGLPDDKILILSVSSNLKRKNLPVVIRTVKELGDKFQLVRVGPPAGDAITFTNVSVEKLNLIYNACDVFLFPTFAEGFGIPLIEAFSTGLPSVVSDIDIMHEVSSDSSIFVNPTVEGCKDGILQALEEREKLKSRGLNRVRLFSRETFKENVTRIYERVERTWTDI